MTEHALILCREPGRHSTLDKGHEEGGSAYANAGSSLRSPPGYSRARSVAQRHRDMETQKINQGGEEQTLAFHCGALFLQS